jgi:acetyl-CoA acetyltransferase
MENKLREAVIVAYGRSAFTKTNKGALKNTHPVDVAARF